MFNILPAKKNIGAEVKCDLKTIDKDQIKKIKLALNKYGMLYFRKQNLNSKNYVNFAKSFGKLAEYPRLKGLNKKYPKITVVQRKTSDKGPSFGEQFHTDSIYTKKPPRFTMLLSKLVPQKGKANTEFCSQYLAYNNLPNKIKIKLKKFKGIYSSKGPISVTTLEREKEKGKTSRELKSKHKIIKKIGSKSSIYCSPGHFVGFHPITKDEIKLKKYLFNHQVKRKFQYSLEWKKKPISYLGQ